MSRFVRWSWVLPRLVLLVALYFGIEYLAGLAIRLGIVHGGQAAVGARVEVDRSVVSLRHAHASIAGVRFANPSKPMENAVDVERIELDFESGSLLRGQVVASHGVVSGLKFGTPRTESGELPVAEPAAGSSDPLGWFPGGADAAEAWLADVGEKLSLDAADQFASVRLAQEMADRWPARYEDLRARAKQLEVDARQIRDDAKEAKRNPLRGAEFLAGLPARAKGLESRLRGLQAELNGLPTEMQGDRGRLAEARRQDEALLRKRLQANQLDSDSLTTYLVGERVTGPLGELMGWVQWLREAYPSKKVDARLVERARGVDVRFVGVTDRPDYLIRALELSGVATISGVPSDFAGTITDLTTEPGLHGAPTRLAIKASGPTPFEVRAILDRTTDVARDEFLVDCPSFATPAATLGAGEKFRFAMAPSRGSLSLSLVVEGDELSGELQVIQDNVSLTPQVQLAGGEFGERLRKAIAESMADLPQAATRVTLGGTVKRPTVKLWSTLGPAVAESMQRSVNRLVEGEAERVAAGARAKIDEKVAALDAKLAEATAGATAELAAPRDLIGQLAGLGGGGFGSGSLSFERLGTSIPKGGSLFK
ncbi:MAG: TIGR03545 family protein [Lacipirellulaceae bacterium]